MMRRYPPADVGSLERVRGEGHGPKEGQGVEAGPGERPEHPQGPEAQEETMSERPWFRITMRVLGILEKMPWSHWAKNAKARRAERRKRRELRRQRREERREDAVPTDSE